MSCFYLDPSHARPYHAALLAFMCEQAGFRLVEQWIDEPGRFALTLVETN